MPLASSQTASADRASPERENGTWQTAIAAVRPLRAPVDRLCTLLAGSAAAWSSSTRWHCSSSHFPVNPGCSSAKVCRAVATLIPCACCQSCLPLQAKSTYTYDFQSNLSEIPSPIAGALGSVAYSNHTHATSLSGCTDECALDGIIPQVSCQGACPETPRHCP